MSTPAPISPHTAKIAAACRALETEDPMPDLATLARRAALSRWHFHRIFKQTVGVTPKAYAKEVRARRVRRELPRRSSITEALYEAGYPSNSRFYSEAKAVLGMQPKRYRVGGAGETLRFAIGQSDLGAILVASSERGVCAILLGDDPEALLRELQDRFPRATLVGGDRDYERIIAQVAGLVREPGAGLALPLDIRGTAFQQRVWQALCRLPAGRTTTYSELAASIGSPAAARAVAGACAANPLAIAIPCHRVVRLDGDLSGYRWGVWRKRALLAKERA